MLRVEIIDIAVDLCITLIAESNIRWQPLVVAPGLQTCFFNTQVSSKMLILKAVLQVWTYFAAATPFVAFFEWYCAMREDSAFAVYQWAQRWMDEI